MWPIPDDELPLNQSHLILTFGPPMSQEIRCKRIEEHFQKLSSLEGWSFYIPDDGVKQQGGDGREGLLVYGAIFEW